MSEIRLGGKKIKEIDSFTIELPYPREVEMAFTFTVADAIDEETVRDTFAAGKDFIITLEDGEFKINVE